MPTKRFPVILFCLILAPALFLNSGCAAIARQFYEQPKVSLASLNVKDVSATGSTLIFGVKVENPNATALRLDSLRYDLEIGGKPFSSGKIDQAAEVRGRSTAIVELPVPVKYTDVFSSLIGFLSKGSSQYKIKGEAQMGFFTIPFENSGEFKLKP